MTNKKIKSIIIFSMLIISALTLIQIVSADELSDSVRGYVYVDGIIQEPNQVTITIDSEERNADKIYSDGYYIINYGTGNISTAEFVVEIDAGSWLADQNDWKTEFIDPVTIYFINLSIDTSTDPVEPNNNPPNTPGNPTPADKANNQGIGVDLSWTGGDPDAGDIVSYDIYFDTSNSPSTLVSADQSATSYNPGSLNYDTTYYWKVVSEDNNGASTDGPVWGFTTETDDTGDTGGGGNTGGGGGGNSGGGSDDGGSSGGDGGSGGNDIILPPSSNSPPIADAGDSYVAFIGEEITFDGSDSTDSDGNIESYRWDFENDGTWDTEWISDSSTTHTYSQAFTGKVKLEVRDDGGLTDTETAAVNILKGNNPPTKPTITGTKSGDSKTSYDFTAQSTDADNDTIKYVFYWNDGTSTESTYLKNGSQITKNHSWENAGKYTINVNAHDGNTWSGNSTHTIYIDAIDVSSGDVSGYIIDEDGDNSFESFNNEDTNKKTKTGKEKGDYLIDTDSDGDWDYKYNTTTGELTEYKNENKNKDTSSDGSNNTILYIGAIVFVVILLAMFYLVSKKKK